MLLIPCKPQGDHLHNLYEADEVIGMRTSEVEVTLLDMWVMEAEDNQN
jgi:hypothetical protein